MRRPGPPETDLRHNGTPGGRNVNRRRERAKEIGEEVEKLRERARRVRLRSLLGGALMVGVGAGAVSTVTLVDHGDPPAGTATESRRAGGEALGFDGPEEAGEAVDAESFGEKENQELLEKVEAGISDFYADLASLIEAVEDEGLKARLKGSFRVIKENENNPDKNWFTLVRHAREGGSVRYTNPNYFAYNFGRELPEEAKGGFAPQSRSLILNKNFHPQDLEGLIFLSNYYFPAGLTNFDLRSPFGRVLAENYRDSAEGEVYVLVGGRYVPYFQ